MPQLTLRLLGPPAIELDGEPVSLGRHKAMALLAYLALSPGSHSRDSLAALLWPELDQRRARAEVRRTLSVLNRTLGDAWLTIDRETAGWAPQDEAWLDVDALRECLAACAAHGHAADEVCEACVPFLSEAVALYRDGFLAGFTLPGSAAFDEWQFFETESLRDALAGALQRLAGWHGGQDEFEAAIPLARRWVSLDPTHEPAQRALMALYARSGQRSAALRQYAECERTLKAELDIAPSEETAQLYEAIRHGLDRPAAGSAADVTLPPLRTDNLPAQSTTFVGRKQALAEIARLLADRDVRLLAVVGPGGMGKTRLALEVARQALPRFPAGAWWVDLAPLPADASRGREAPVSRTVAAALGVQEQPDRPLPEVIADSLQTRELLLVLDNCEHVIDGAARLVGLLLSRCPDLTVLTTSREPLHVPGEHLYEVPPMDLPGAGEMAARRLDADAVQLFGQRAVAVRPGFSLEGCAALVADVCQRLDGMPLAIELAAARLRALSLAEVAGRLDDRFRLLTGGSRTALPRQRTLRYTVEWSVELLDPAEQALFARLSVFIGGFDLEAAEAVCGGEGVPAAEVLDRLASLVDKSLVIAVHGEGGTTRYRLLETLRAYARERLAARGETDVIAARHARCYLALAERLEPQLLAWEKEMLTAFAYLDAEADNLAAAMRWSLSSGETEVALRIGGVLRSWLEMRLQHLYPYAEWLERALAQGGTVNPGTRARALSVIHRSAMWKGDYDKAAVVAEEALDLARRTENPRLIGRATWDSGGAAAVTGQPEQARALCQEALQIGREHGDLWLVCDALEDLAAMERDLSKRYALMEELLAQAPYCLQFFPMMHLGRTSYELGALERSAAWYRSALARCVELGTLHGQGDMLGRLANIAGRRGDNDRAIALSERSQNLFRQSGGRLDAAYALAYLGHAVYSRGEYRSARQYYEQSHALFVAVGLVWAVWGGCTSTSAMSRWPWVRTSRPKSTIAKPSPATRKRALTGQ